MSKYLWDLQITDFPYADQESYDYFIDTYPQGKIVTINCQIQGPKDYFTDPVGYKNKLEELFELYSSEARSAFKDMLTNFSKESLNRLLKYESILYLLLWDWELDFKDVTSTDPTTIEKSIENNEQIEIYYDINYRNSSFDKYTLVNP